MANASSRPRRAFPRVERVRRGWVFRDSDGRGWWVDDSVTVNGTHRVVPGGHPSATCRVFTPMIGARETARRLYRFRVNEDHSLVAHRLSRQLRAAS